MQKAAKMKKLIVLLICITICPVLFVLYITQVCCKMMLSIIEMFGTQISNILCACINWAEKIKL